MAKDKQGKKKKGPIIIVVLILVIILAFACGGNGDKDKVKPTTGVESDSVSESKNNSTNDNDSAAEVSLEETVIYDANDIKITVNEYSGTSWLGAELSVQIENNSSQDVAISTRDLSVNGMMFETSGLFSTVAAGKKANDVLRLYSTEMNEQGISIIAEIEFYLNISDSNTFADIDKSDLITLKTSVADSYVQEYDDSGDVIYDQNDIRVICKGLKDETFWDGMVVFYIENNSDRAVTVYSEDVSVNGFMEDASFWVDIQPGKKCMDGITLLDMSDLELESLDDVETIELSLKIIGENDWSEIDKTEPITLTFN